MNQKLIGDDLLARLKELGDVSKTEKAAACGYFSYKSNGTIRYNYTAMYQAISEANGVPLERKVKGKRSLKWQAQVLTTGAILVGSRYVEELGLKPGDKIGLTRSGKKLILEAVEG